MCYQLLTRSVSFSYNIPTRRYLQLSQGALFTHWIADSLTLWKSPVTDEHLWTAATYYSILAKGPPETLYFLSAVVILGGITILWSLRDGEAGNIMFDGGSICGTLLYPFLNTFTHLSCAVLFGTTIVMYLHSVLPSPFHPLVSPECLLITCYSRPLCKIHLLTLPSTQGSLSTITSPCDT
jgi:ER membrane protein SH3